MDTSHRPTVGSSQSTSPSLLERLKGNDSVAWEHFAAVYGPMVYGWCRRLGLQDQDAADVSQEVFRAVAGNIRRFRRDAANHTFRGWLWTITRNKIRDLGRDQAGKAHAQGGSTADARLQQIAEPPDDVSSVSNDAVDGRGLLQRAADIIRSEFEEQTWQIFYQIVIEGRRATDVAADLKMTASAVRQAKYRVLRRLRQEFDGLLD